MSNAGVRKGVGLDGWTEWRPAWRCASLSGTPTDPILDYPAASWSQARNIGRYIRLQHGWVVAQIQLQLYSGATVGSGDAYVWKLPVPAERVGDELTASRVPIGTAMVYLPFIGATNRPCVAHLADPSLLSLGGAWNEYFMVRFPFLWARGTGTWPTSTSTAQTITHNLGYAPAASDIRVVLTQGSTIGNSMLVPCPFVVDTITATTFNITPRGSLGASTVTYEWNVEMEPSSNGSVPSVVSPTQPWLWFADGFHALFVRLAYKAKS